MATKNRRVAAYLPKAIDEKLEAFKSERGGLSDSQALIDILSKFFEVPREMGLLPGQQEAIFQRLQNLEASHQSDLEGFRVFFTTEIDELKERITGLEQSVARETTHNTSQEQSEPSSELPGESESVEQPKEPESQSDQAEEVEPKVDTEKTVSKTPVTQKASPSTVPKNLDGGLTGAALARHLNVTQPAVSKARNKYSDEKFAEWTKEKDPNKKAWMWGGDDIKKYFLVDEPPASLQGKLPWQSSDPAVDRE